VTPLREWRKGQMPQAANFWERQNILTFIIDVFMIFFFNFHAFFGTVKYFKNINK
jgi:hypothetical protein